MTAHTPVATRRQALGTLGSLAASTLPGCGGGGETVAATGAETLDALSASTVCVVTATETAGPYPLTSFLDNTAVLLRRDITESKTGIPVTLTLKVVDYDNSCAAISGAAVYIWHCDAAGEYSGYASTQNGSHAGETYLRGVQLTSSAGKVTFKTIFPGWYIPRLTHIHVQVFLPSTTLSSTATATATTQLCFPDAITTAAYNNTTLYSKGQNTTTPTYASDQVFGNGIGSETLTVSGDASTGYVASIVIGISSTTTNTASGDSTTTTTTTTGGSGAGGMPPTGTPPSAPV